MTTYAFDALPAYDPDTGALVKNGVGRVYAVIDTAFASPLAVTDLNGIPMVDIVASSIGMLPEFKVEDHPQVVWKSGGYTILLSSVTGLMEAAQAAATAADEAAQAAAQAAAAAAAAQAAAEAAAGSGGDGGLSTTQLNTYLGGDAQNLIDRMIMPRLRVDANTWEARPDCRVALTIGALPAPDDLGNFDVFIEDAS